MIQIHPLKRRKRKEMKEDPNLVANGRFQCLMALGRFQCLVALERKKRSTFSPLPTFSPTILLKPSFFPLILRFYITMVLGY
jgi:hypothetical protein